MNFNKLTVTNILTLMILVFALCASLVTFKPSKTYAINKNGVEVTYCKLPAAGGKVQVRTKFVASTLPNYSHSIGSKVVSYYTGTSTVAPGQTKYLTSTAVPNSTSVYFNWSVDTYTSPNWNVYGLLWC